MAERPPAIESAASSEGPENLSIPWPHGPFSLGSNVWGTFWTLVLVGSLLLTIGSASAAMLAKADAIQQQIVDTAISIGAAKTLSAARVTASNCTRWRGGFGRSNGGHYVCKVAVVDGSTFAHLKLSTSFKLKNPKTLAVGRMNGRYGIVLPPQSLVLDWFPLLLAFFIIFVVIGLGLLTLAIGLRQLQLLRFARCGRVVPVDLLKRRRLPLGWARWHFAFDLNGQRRFSTGMINRPPILWDGVVTRGAAMVTSAGKAVLLTRFFSPFHLPPGQREAAESAVQRAFYVPRIRMEPATINPALQSLTASEKAYAAAWFKAWNAEEVAAINDAVEDRHRAAARLEPEQLDVLLTTCRALSMAGR